MRRRVWPTDHHITRLLVDSLVSLNAISRLCGGGINAVMRVSVMWRVLQ